MSKLILKPFLFLRNVILQGKVTYIVIQTYLVQIILQNVYGYAFSLKCFLLSYKEVAY